MGQNSAHLVIPAKAGIHFYAMLVRATKWIPASAGMTNLWEFAQKYL